MSSVPPSNTLVNPSNGQNKRTSCTGSVSLPTEGYRPSSTPITKPTVPKTPLAAALELGMSHVATLNNEAKPFLQETIKQVQQKKYQEMVRDPNYIPSSRKIGLTLMTVLEVRQSENFIALNAQLDTAISQAQYALAGYALRAYNMT